ncbi:MAG TPA: response regulator [Kofleriaceae bacterium]|nr:response regulator [Kofleriaceae bacterium]
MTILIVEDEADHADLLAEFLIGRGHRALVANTAEDALALAKTTSFDLVVLDLLLPDMTGPVLVTRLRELGVQCRIVVATGYQDQQTLGDTLAAGATSILVKPFALAKIDHELACARGVAN